MGKTTRQKLYQIGIHTLGQVRDYPEAFLCRHFGKFGKRLKELAHGVDRSKVSLSAERKSVSTETTLTEDTSDKGPAGGKTTESGGNHWAAASKNGRQGPDHYLEGQT